MAALSCVSSLWRHVGCVPEHVLILHFNLSLQCATWWPLLAAQPIHKRLRKKKSPLSLNVFLQKSVHSSNLCFVPQNRHFVEPFGPGFFDLLELVGSDLPLPPPLADVDRELHFSFSGFGFGFLLQRWSYWREHLKYVWNVYCDVTNHRRDHHTKETTSNERFPICHGTNYFHFVLTFSLFTSKQLLFLPICLQYLL